MQVVRSEVVAELLDEQRVSSLDDGQEDASAARPALLRILAWRPLSCSAAPNSHVFSVQIDADGDVDVPRRHKRPRWSKPTDVKDPETHRETLIVLETTLAGDVNETGTQIWRASFVLAEFIQSRESEFHGKVVLELGCGVGFVAIAAARVAQRVFATDGDVAALAVCQRNVRRNCSELDAVLVRYLDWENETATEALSVNPQFQWTREDQATVQNAVDWIVASDVFYDDEVADLFLDKLHRLLVQHPTARAVVSMEKRVVFSAVTLSEISLGYDAFRARLCPHEATSQATIVCCSKCALDTQTPTTRFIATQIPLHLLPRVYQYERVSTLEIWELRRALSSSSYCTHV